MSNHTLPHQNSVIQQPGNPVISFFATRCLLTISEEHKISQNTNIITQNNQLHNTKPSNQDIHKTKRHFYSIHNLSHSSSESLQKSSLTNLAQKSPRSTFPKTQVHLNSNALAFSSKRKRVFQKALWSFLPNTSEFLSEISLFTQIFPYLIS